MDDSYRTKNKYKTKMGGNKRTTNTMYREKAKKGGSIKKKKSKFPDHSGDGKITKKDILMAKGIIPKTKKKTMRRK